MEGCPQGARKSSACPGSRARGLPPESVALLLWRCARRRFGSARQTDIARGEFEAQSRVTPHEYALAWVERYLGRGRSGYREGTRDEYRRQLKQYVLAYFPERTKLTEVMPSRVAPFVA
jgi:hypothetical protein